MRPWPVGRGREAALVVVVAIGCVQAALTYADFPGGPRGTRLAGPAREGLRLWRTHNCQVCHQLWGFGGFLGPDLTNVAARYTSDELEPVLTAGRNAMPAFELDRKQRAALYAFLAACDASGQGQPTGLQSRARVDPRLHFTRVTEAAAARLGRPLPEPVARGVAVVERQACGLCHVPLTTGRWQAPDLTLVADVRTPEAIRDTLRTGRNAMPAFGLTDAETADVVAWLGFCAAARDALRAANDALCDRETFAWDEVPWFDYR